MNHAQPTHNAKPIASFSLCQDVCSSTHVAGIRCTDGFVVGAAGFQDDLAESQPANTVSIRLARGIMFADVYNDLNVTL